MKAVIIGSGEIRDTSFIRRYCSDSIVICCDGGAEYAFREGIMPDYIIGDMDSAAKEIIAYFEAKGTSIKKYPAKKDFTDMELGIEAAFEQKAEEIIILGGTGTRLDHTITNIQLLKKINDRGLKGSLINENNIIRLTDNTITIEGKKGDIVSLIPFTENVRGIKTEGLEYSLCNYDMETGHSIGVSNVLTKEKATIKINDGLLLVIQAKD